MMWDGLHGCMTITFCASSQELRLAAEAFRKDGVICLRGAFDKATCQLVAEGISANMLDPSALGEWIGSDRTRFFSDLASWRRIYQFEQFAKESGSCAPAARTSSLTSNDINLKYMISAKI